MVPQLRIYIMDPLEFEDARTQLARLLRGMRSGRGVSQRHFADEARVNHSVVARAERGEDGKIGTWEKLFEALGYRLTFKVDETLEEIPDLLAEEAGQREDRRREGLC